VLNSSSSCFPSIVLPPPRPPLFPYTTLFRSVEAAFTRARAAQAAWAATPPAERKRIMLRFHDLVIAGRDEAMDLMQAENGKTRRSEEHTSELQSRENLVCRLLLEKKKVNKQY